MKCPRLVGAIHLLLISASVTCTSGPEQAWRDDLAPRPGAPRVRSAGSITLEESDSVFLGSPGTDFAVDPQGAMYFPDRSTDQVLRFGPDGHLDRIIGRRGSGPGELRGVGAVIHADSGRVVVHGYQNFRVSLFEGTTGEFLGAATHTGSLTSLRLSGDTLWFGTMGSGTGKTVGAVAVTQIRTGELSDGLVGHLVDAPEEYRRYPGLEAFNNVVVHGGLAQVVVGFGGLDELVVFDVGGSAQVSLRVPYRARRGVPPSQLERYFRTRNLPAATIFPAISNLAGIWRMADGTWVLHHRDLEEENPTARNSQTIGRSFVSLLTPDFRRACVDGPVPATVPGYPRLQFHRDTLYQLEQRVASGGQNRVQTLVNKYTMDASNCEWLDVAR